MGNSDLYLGPQPTKSAKLEEIPSKLPEILSSQGWDRQTEGWIARQ